MSKKIWPNKTKIYSCFIFILLLLLLLPTWSCKKEAKKQTKDNATVCFEKKDTEKVCVNVEVADTARLRARGLMYRRELDQDQGMLFIFPQEDQKFFWMKNTYIPLDMIFINEDLEVVGILENVEPLTEELRSVGVPSILVVEVNGGWAARHGVEKGCRVKINLP
jgi:uncharacterized membrane protein (UPF0127 family)